MPGGGKWPPHSRHSPSNHARNHITIAADGADDRCFAGTDTRSPAAAIHTQTIGGFWSIFKRGVVGTFHKMSRKYPALCRRVPIPL
jgi:hypothetical protein